MALEHESGVFRAHLMDLLGEDDVNEGKYVVIKGDKILPASYDDDSAALAAGDGRLGPVPFLVKKVQRVEPVLDFTRDL